VINCCSDSNMSAAHPSYKKTKSGSKELPLPVPGVNPGTCRGQPTF
jgi:hypothetical protein